MDVFRWFFACHHRRVSRVMTMNDQTFQVCLSCGERLPYCWETLSRVRPRSQPTPKVMPGYAAIGTGISLAGARVTPARQDKG